MIVAPLPIPPFKSVVTDQAEDANGRPTQPFQYWLTAVDRMVSLYAGGAFGAGPIVAKAVLPKPPLKHFVVGEEGSERNGYPTQPLLIWLTGVDRMRMLWGGTAFGAGPAVVRAPLPPYTFRYIVTNESRDLDGYPTQPFFRWLTFTDAMYRVWAGGAF